MNADSDRCRLRRSAHHMMIMIKHKVDALLKGILRACDLALVIFMY